MIMKNFFIIEDQADTFGTGGCRFKSRTRWTFLMSNFTGKLAKCVKIFPSKISKSYQLFPDEIRIGLNLRTQSSQKLVTRLYPLQERKIAAPSPQCQHSDFYTHSLRAYRQEKVQVLVRGNAQIPTKSIFSIINWRKPEGEKNTISSLRKGLNLDEENASNRLLIKLMATFQFSTLKTNNRSHNRQKRLSALAALPANIREEKTFRPQRTETAAQLRRRKSLCHSFGR